MPQPPPTNTFFGWLGRQVGHVKKAVQAPPPAPPPQILYRQDKVEEKQLPNQPGVILRRTTIDEVIVDENSKPPVQNPRTND